MKMILFVQIMYILPPPVQGEVTSKYEAEGLFEEKNICSEQKHSMLVKNSFRYRTEQINNTGKRFTFRYTAVN